MDPFILAAIISGIVIIILSIAFLRVSQVKPQAAARPRAVVQRDGGPGRVQAVRNQRARMRANAARHQAALEEEPEIQEEADEGAPDIDQKIDFDDKMGAKKRAKMEAKLEKKKAREAEDHLREIKKKKEEEQEQERKKIEEKQEEEERKREEAEKKAEDERKKREQEEYEAMKAAFSIEGEGFDENEEEDRESLLRDFIGYIKTQKVVLLEDLAAHFKLKTQAAIDRITELQASGELTGVIDDRGKFIYISQSELESIAKFIKQRGRVSIAELAECSNDLINLAPVTVP
ncbi:DDRGK domain-containing protein 1 [Bombyx mandarina]|uniref:DDRGK domain-containing protein 1 n=1 Tax=Bombyx mandarina TaxID=7092 RepID=A0A6J2K5F7_BOMMA|nr:DDRGK domain-containing protein 1 [Bombyx mandarina]XP_028035515.1 DDRGK domain-containing protein 1 [Bombyx mandarina]XP_028035516.1 DDRGK domain-containing protein 1 [Bombyx mandarina]